MLASRLKQMFAPIVAGFAASRVVLGRFSPLRPGAKRREAMPRGDGSAGAFLVVDCVKLHYLDTGSGAPAIVIFHGNGGMIEEVVASGLVGELSRHHRVIVFDRPGFGLSERPPRGNWSPEGQATLFAAALTQLRV